VAEPAASAQPGLRLTADDASDASDASRLRDGVAAIIDYRGDVTIACTDGRSVIGYVFACSEDDDPELRVMPADGGAPLTVPLNDIATIEVTGRDTAAGKSFESWIKRYAEKKLAGEAASIDSEPLELDEQ